MTYTQEQEAFFDTSRSIFLEACPGSGKTKSIVGRIQRISMSLKPRHGIAVLSFTNSAVKEFESRCNKSNLFTGANFPSFMGTFDSFVRMFLIIEEELPSKEVKSTLVESWRSLGIEVRLRGGNAFRGGGVSLDHLDPLTGEINEELIGHTGLRNHFVNNRADYNQAASRYLRSLNNKGIYSTSDFRKFALQNLVNPEISPFLSQALVSRFVEIIVDEAQDSNEVDLAILEWLQESKIRVTIVCDPNQAIYGFRKLENQDHLFQFRDRFLAEQKISLTGNFRSSPVVCSLAATLRNNPVPDIARGDTRDIEHPVHVISYDGPIANSIGNEFSRILDDYEVDRNHAAILSHKKNSAIIAGGGISLNTNTGTSKIGILARAIVMFSSTSTDSKSRERALTEIEKLILRVEGNIEDTMPLQQAIYQNEINKRKLRRLALEIAISLTSNCADTDDARRQWIEQARTKFDGIGLNLAQGITIRGFFRTPPNVNWFNAFQIEEHTEVPYSTIHEAKGKEFQAVCVVIPPNRAPLNYTADLFQAWQDRNENESKRVLYVGVTRAQALITIALPNNYRAVLTDILDNAGIAWQLSELA